MSETEKIRINYYVGALLAQGGDAYLDKNNLVFSPTGSLDRAMGAVDVFIPFNQIDGIVNNGDLFKSFQVKTKSKTHKFQGGQAMKLVGLLEASIKEIGLGIAVLKNEKQKSNQAVESVPRPMCFDCGRMLRSEFAYCPYCGVGRKPVCQKCNGILDKDWAMCAHCGIKLAA